MTTTSILITGCSSGIGRYCAEQLHQSGYLVIASCRHMDDVEQLQSQGLHCVQLDVTDTDSVHNALAQTLQITGGTLDVLFNNAGFGQGGAIEDFRPMHCARNLKRICLVYMNSLAQCCL